MSTEPKPSAPGAPVPGAVPALRWILVVLLAAAALAALFGLPRASQGGWPSGVRLVPVGLLVLFVGGYAVYRYVLVRAGRYSEGKAIVRVGAMVLLLGVIASIALERPPAPPVGPSLDLTAPLASADPALRALAAEVVRSRPPAEGARHVERLVVLLADPSLEVRREARASLGVLAGVDAGEGPEAAGRWREILRSRGLLPGAR